MHYSIKVYAVLFGGASFFALLNLPSLYGSNQITEVQGYVKTSHDAFERYERLGNYATALEIARNDYQNALKKGLVNDVRTLSQGVERLEKELLTLGASRLVFDEGYQPSVKLLELLECMGMKPLNASEKALVQINQWAQENLLREGERWDNQEDHTNSFEKLNPKIQQILRELGFVDATYAHFKNYQGALVHGGDLPTVRLRLHHLIEQWKQGVRFSHIYFLSGERFLDPKFENEHTLIEEDGSPLKIRKDWVAPVEFPQTETELMQFIWEQSEIPEDMRKETRVHLINAPAKKDSKGEKVKRPTTEDTVVNWLKASPPFGRYLAITNAPFTNRQDLVVRAIAPSEYGFETIGSQADEQEKAAIFFDDLARYIFQIKELSEKE